MNAKVTAEKILQEVGGEKNVQNLTHCVTRLRFSLHSMEGVDEEKVKQIPGVLGVVNKGGQFQVIIGQEVPVVFAEVQKLGSFAGAGEGEENRTESGSGYPGRYFLTHHAPDRRSRYGEGAAVDPDLVQSDR